MQCGLARTQSEVRIGAKQQISPGVPLSVPNELLVDEVCGRPSKDSAACNEAGMDVARPMVESGTTGPQPYYFC